MPLCVVIHTRHICHFQCECVVKLKNSIQQREWMWALTSEKKRDKNRNGIELEERRVKNNVSQNLRIKWVDKRTNKRMNWMESKYCVVIICYAHFIYLKAFSTKPWIVFVVALVHCSFQWYGIRTMYFLFLPLWLRFLIIQLLNFFTYHFQNAQHNANISNVLLL